MATAEGLMTAAQFLEMPDTGELMELVRGEVIAMPPPGFPHGVICSKIVYVLMRFLAEHDLGKITCNDSGVITERDPDTVRGADVAFYSYERIPKGTLPQGYPDVAAEVAFEVLSPSDSWAEVLVKVGEYLHAGVKTVCVLDPDNRSVHAYRPDQPPRICGSDDELALVEISPLFRERVAQFFT
jgi:Uma2 family endonuclease